MWQRTQNTTAAFQKTEITFLHMLITLNLGTNLANSWCQLLRVEAGEIIKKGPQMFSLWNLHIKKTTQKLIGVNGHRDSLIQLYNYYMTVAT